MRRFLGQAVTAALWFGLTACQVFAQQDANTFTFQSPSEKTVANPRMDDPTAKFQQQSLEELMRIGEQAVESGDYATAADAFAAASAKEPQRPEPRFNEGVAHFRAGNLDRARDLFQQVANSSRGVLRAKARYNLGATEYAQAVARQGANPEATKQQLRTAIEHFRSSLSESSKPEDARANIELAARFLRNLEQQQQQQQQQQEQEQEQDQEQGQEQEGDPSNQQQDGESSDSGTQQQESPQDRSSQPEEGQDSPASPSQANESKTNKPQSNTEDTQPNSTPSSESNTESSTEQAQKNDSQTAMPQADEPTHKEQDSAQQRPTAQQSVDTPKDEVKEQSPASESPPASEQSNAPQAGSFSSAITRLEAEKLLQAVRDRNFRRRMERLKRERQRRILVERDW